MRAGLLFLLAALFLSPAGAQTAATEGEAHILSAFTTRADPRVLSPEVNVGPLLREQLGARTDIYAALVEQTMGKRLRVTLLPPGDAARYASIPGFTPGEPLIRLDAADLSLLMQYAPGQKTVTLVEQISAPQPAARAAPEPPPPAPEPPKPVIEAAPLPLVPVTPPVVATPKPTPRAAPKPVPKPAPAAVAPKPAPAVAAPAVAATPRAAPKPRGDCVIKPVMSEQDMWNCSGPGRSTPIPPAPEVDVQAAPAVPPALAAPPECVIKPVMSEEELRICAAASRQSRGRAASTAPLEAAPAVAAATPAPPAPQPQCVIKPVMTEEDMRICAAAARQSRPAPAEPEPQPVAAQKPAPAAPPAALECVIKPVMSEAELRACGVRR